MFLSKHESKFVSFSKDHVYNTRRQVYVYPVHSYTKTESSVTYACIRLYNVLPEAIKSITDKNRFKTCIKAFLINLEPYSLDDYYSTVNDMSLYNF